MRIRCHPIAIVALTLLLPRADVAAQSTASSITSQAIALIAAGDSAQAMATLESVLYPHSKDATAWHLYGQLKWQAAAATRSGGFIGDAKTIRALQLADSALRLATKFAPDSAEYWITLARFNLQSGVATMRFAASRQMELAYDAAKGASDSARMGESADEFGMAIWRRYETLVNRALVGADQRVQLQTDGRWNRAHAKDFLDSFSKKIQPPTGVADYTAAMNQFRIATAVAPLSLRHSRHLYMGLAVGKRWDELLSVATRRATASMFDAQARFARGVALHRLHRLRDARAAFDTAMSMMDDSERVNLFRFDRLLAPMPNVLTGKGGVDQSAVSSMTPAQRQAVSALYWAVNDPVSATAENEAELEFFSRVLQAEWQWTDEDQKLRGADTDRGDIFVRYGPPDDEITFPGTPSVQQFTPDTQVDSNWNPMSTNQMGGATLAWLYRTGEVFFFDMSPGFGTARTALTDQKYVSEVQSVKPAEWGNIFAPRRVDSLPLRATRFRAGRDSSDIVFAARIPIRTLLDSASDISATDGTEMRVDFRVLDGAARVISMDTSYAHVAADSVATGGARVWEKRISAGPAIARIDAVLTEAMRSANSLLTVDAAPTAGFAVSDVLLVQVGAAPPRANAERWRDLHVTPSAGEYRAGEKVGLAWETYELVDSAGTNRYRIAVTVDRVKRTGASEFALRVLDALGSVIGQSRGSTEKRTLTYDRNVAAREIQVDYLTLDWTGESRGDYTLRVEITDMYGKRVVVRETRFRIE